MFLSVVIPCYNEEKRLRPSLEEIFCFLGKKNFESEIIVVSDGSKDKTTEVVIDFIKKHERKNVKIIGLEYQPNRGKGYATRTGMLAAKGDYMYLCDSDLSTPIEELDKFLKYKDQYDIVIASRAMANSKVNTSLPRKVMGRVGNFLINTILVKDIKDTQAGFKLFNKKCRKLFIMQKIERWGFDFEILYLAQRLGYKIKELAVKWEHKEDSKVKPFHYFKTLSELIKIRLTKYNFNEYNKKG
ncbi:glycosyltransferase family 2 protein [Candidatus Dojkabacteria bacterium]|nr:glycosyltransferase family 2 protein [Candidatus Dojkabacteria bacterium]